MKIIIAVISTILIVIGIVITLTGFGGCCEIGYPRDVKD